LSRDLKQHFEALHRARSEPWQVTRRWYEIRKRSLLMASLPWAHYGRVLELGCSTGVCTEQLATRSDEVVALDFSEAAIATARRRLAGTANVRFVITDVATGLPDGDFDLVVLSEVGYYLAAGGFDHVIRRSRTKLTPGGHLMLCHWRHAEDDFLQLGEEVHHRVIDDPHWTTVVSHEEDDFLLHVAKPANRPDSTTRRRA
jgi:SAM-dependent methyltransferase